ncbi:MAG: hypothetical protein KDK02_05775 [Rhodobacteraceae bacterium]|nr:hypothetical protein [Paracoccaceae bacterium]
MKSVVSKLVLGLVLGAGIATSGLCADTIPEVQKRAIAALSEDLLYPEKAKIRGLASAHSPDGTWITCGYVFPMSSSGVRGRQWTFRVEEKPDDNAFISIAQDNDGFWIILEICRKKGVPILSPEVVSEIPPKLIVPDN